MADDTRNDDNRPIGSLAEVSDTDVSRSIGRNLTRALQGLARGNLEDVILGGLAVIGGGAELGDRGVGHALQHFDLRRVVDEAVRSYVVEQGASPDAPGTQVTIDADYLDDHPGLSLRIFDFVAARLGELMGLRTPAESPTGVDTGGVQVHYDLAVLLKHLATSTPDRRRDDE